MIFESLTFHTNTGGGSYKIPVDSSLSRFAFLVMKYDLWILDVANYESSFFFFLIRRISSITFYRYSRDLRNLVRLVLIRFSALDKRKDRVPWCLPSTRYLYIDMTISGLDATRQTKIGDESCGDAGISADGHSEGYENHSGTACVPFTVHNC